jgi:hypothetical protein
MWVHYDAFEYQDIARHWYADPHNTAFFPLFPLGIRFLSELGLSPTAAGLIISGVGSLVAGIYLYRLAVESFNEEVGIHAVTYLMLFPTAVFLVAPYSESLFLAGAVAAFYYARRAQWLRSSLPIAIAVGTRVTGVFLLLGLAAEFVRQRQFDRRSILRAGGAIILGSLPLVVYTLYLWASRGNPLYFLTAEHNGWHRVLASPISAFLATWRGLWQAPTGGVNRLVLLGELVATAVGVLFTVVAARRREWGYAVFMGSLMLVLLIDGPTYFSIPRMLLTLFPIPLLLAAMTRGRPVFHEAALAFSVMFATLGVLVWTGGGWFY